MGLKSLKGGALCFSQAAPPTTRSRQVGFVVTSEYLHFLASYYSDINWGKSVPLICAYFLKWKGHLLKKERVKETGQLFKICNGVAYLFLTSLTQGIKMIIQSGQTFPGHMEPDHE